CRAAAPCRSCAGCAPHCTPALRPQLSAAPPAVRRRASSRLFLPSYACHLVSEIDWDLQAIDTQRPCQAGGSALQRTAVRRQLEYPVRQRKYPPERAHALDGEALLLEQPAQGRARKIDDVIVQQPPPARPERPRHRAADIRRQHQQPPTRPEYAMDVL